MEVLSIHQTQGTARLNHRRGGQRWVHSTERCRLGQRDKDIITKGADHPSSSTHSSVRKMSSWTAWLAEVLDDDSVRGVVVTDLRGNAQFESGELAGGAGNVSLTAFFQEPREDSRETVSGASTARNTSSDSLDCLRLWGRKCLVVHRMHDSWVWLVEVGRPSFGFLACLTSSGIVWVLLWRPRLHWDRVRRCLLTAVRDL